MSSKFGFLSKLTFLQNFASKFIAGINPAVIHNLEKYLILKKVHYLSAIEEAEGDYLEFGVYTGSSFCHSIRCTKKSIKLNSKLVKARFFGFDSFEGFGELSKDDEHPFYVNENFKTSFDVVNRRVAKVAKGLEYKLIKGFFNDTLKDGHEALGIAKTRILFIDSDTYSSSIEALLFCIPTIQEGTIIVLDDYFSYKGSEKYGVAKAYNEFLEKGNFKTRRMFDYGMGGCVFIISEK